MHAPNWQRRSAAVSGLVMLRHVQGHASSMTRPEPERPRLPGWFAVVRGTTIHRTSVPPTETGINPITGTATAVSVLLVFFLLPVRFSARAGAITVAPGVHRAAGVAWDARHPLPLAAQRAFRAVHDDRVAVSVRHHAAVGPGTRASDRRRRICCAFVRKIRIITDFLPGHPAIPSRPAPDAMWSDLDEEPSMFVSHCRVRLRVTPARLNPIPLPCAATDVTQPPGRRPPNR
jgi:hypothetical protein